MFWIEHNGERQVVSSLDGYPGHKLLAKDVPPRPDFATDFQSGKWVVDEEAKAEAQEIADLAALGSRGRLKKARREGALLLLEALEAEGVVNANLATRIRNRLGG
jgi:hypothetical protein